ncbi:hypothetical protein QBL02_13295 [Leucobacter sp. UT-8R-CII-1-4]|uniref:hypothetical protein n=1 Tax=Leucobacter sp. UT-8R-CII-1-4 TaxID=3040075 RepID=UPI0024A90517|nr:hypothetical protein [Leucobacter sp. UT-8R-CII-1-4]MDI6024513.1 hypothetical protein [Leucobacter sp. UT-8R-CII-1-4]
MKLTLQPTVSTRTPLVEAGWSVCAWAIVGPAWYTIDALRSPFQTDLGGALVMLPWFLGIAVFAFALRLVTTQLFRTRAAYYLVDVAVLLCVALIIALFTGNSSIDPEGALIFLAIRLALVGVPLALCTVTLSIALPTLWHRLTANKRPRNNSVLFTADRI